MLTYTTYCYLTSCQASNEDKVRRDEMGVDEVYSKLWYKIGKTTMAQLSLVSA